MTIRMSPKVSSIFSKSFSTAVNRIFGSRGTGLLGGIRLDTVVAGVFCDIDDDDAMVKTATQGVEAAETANKIYKRYELNEAIKNLFLFFFRTFVWLMWCLQVPLGCQGVGPQGRAGALANGGLEVVIGQHDLELDAKFCSLHFAHDVPYPAARDHRLRVSSYNLEFFIFLTLV